MESVTTVITDKKQLVKLISFFVMGDGGVYYNGRLSKQNNKFAGNCRFIMNMRSKNMDYIEHVAGIINNITSCKIITRKMKNIDGCNREQQHTIYSAQHPFFTKLRERIYTGTYKGLDSHYLKLIDGESLAILYMCDGSLSIETPGRVPRLKNNSYNVTLNLKRLSEGDILMLKKAIKDNLNLEFNLQKQGKYKFLRLRCKNVIQFMELVSPYIFPSFEYKLIPSYRTIGPEKPSGDDTV